LPLRIKIGEQAPEAALVKADGKSYNLSENKGKPYLFFYASWNPYIGKLQSCIERSC
jgi:peroxiredoxin